MPAPAPAVVTGRICARACRSRKPSARPRAAGTPPPRGAEAGTRCRNLHRLVPHPVASSAVPEQSRAVRLNAPSGTPVNVTGQEPWADVRCAPFWADRASTLIGSRGANLAAVPLFGRERLQRSGVPEVPLDREPLRGWARAAGGSMHTIHHIRPARESLAWGRVLAAQYRNPPARCPRRRSKRADGGAQSGIAKEPRASLRMTGQGLAVTKCAKAKRPPWGRELARPTALPTVGGCRSQQH